MPFAGLQEKQALKGTQQGQKWDAFSGMCPLCETNRNAVHTKNGGGCFRANCEQKRSTRMLVNIGRRFWKN